MSTPQRPLQAVQPLSPAAAGYGPTTGRWAAWRERRAARAAARTTRTGRAAVRAAEALADTPAAKEARKVGTLVLALLAACAGALLTLAAVACRNATRHA